MNHPNLAQYLRRLRQDAALTEDEAKRGYKRVTQELLAARLGWASSAHVSEIETGKRTPSEDTVTDWVRACGGDGDQLYHARGLAGTIPLTGLPPADQIIAYMRTIDQTTLSRHPYPAYILDYRNLIWAFNSACEIFALTKGITLQAILRRRTDLFQLLFDRRLVLLDTVVNVDELHRTQVAAFRQINVRRQHEPFYRRLPESVATTLQPADAAQFLGYWGRSSGASARPMHRNRAVVRLGGVTVDFMIRAEQVYNDGILFSAICLEPNPTVEQDFEAINALFAPYRGGPSALLCDLIDVAALVEEYNTDR